MVRAHLHRGEGTTAWVARTNETGRKLGRHRRDRGYTRMREAVKKITEEKYDGPTLPQQAALWQIDAEGRLLFDTGDAGRAPPSWIFQESTRQAGEFSNKAGVRFRLYELVDPPGRRPVGLRFFLHFNRPDDQNMDRAGGDPQGRMGDWHCRIHSLCPWRHPGDPDRTDRWRSPRADFEHGLPIRHRLPDGQQLHQRSEAVSEVEAERLRLYRRR